MKKQDQIQSVSELTTNNLLTDELTLRTDFTDPTYLQMLASFEEKLKVLGRSITKGKPFSEYYKALKVGESSDQPIENITQLSDVVGGKFYKSRAAYEAYLEFSSPNITTKAVPHQFSQWLINSIKVDVEAVWCQMQREINDALAEKTTQFEAEKSILLQRFVEGDELIDTLKGQIETQKESQLDHEEKMEELAEVRGQLSQLEDFRVEIERLQVKETEYQKEIVELKIANRQLEIQSYQLVEQCRELQHECDSANTERYRLEGRLEQYLSQQSLT